MKCNQCNHENKAGAQFCVKCGAPIAAENICSACGAENKPGAKFCKKCGQTLGKPPAPAPAPEPEESAPQAPTEQSVKADQSDTQRNQKVEAVEPAPEQPKQPSKFSIKPLWLIVSAIVITLGVGAYFLFFHLPPVCRDLDESFANELEFDYGCDEEFCYVDVPHLSEFEEAWVEYTDLDGNSLGEATCVLLDGQTGIHECEVPLNGQTANGFGIQINLPQCYLDFVEITAAQISEAQLITANDPCVKMENIYANDMDYDFGCNQEICLIDVPHLNEFDEATVSYTDMGGEFLEFMNCTPLTEKPGFHECQVPISKQITDGFGIEVNLPECSLTIAEITGTQISDAQQVTADDPCISFGATVSSIEFDYEFDPAVFNIYIPGLSDHQITLNYTWEGGSNETALCALIVESGVWACSFPSVFQSNNLDLNISNGECQSTLFSFSNEYLDWSFWDNCTSSFVNGISEKFTSYYYGLFEDGFAVMVPSLNKFENSRLEYNWDDEVETQPAQCEESFENEEGLLCILPNDETKEVLYLYVAQNDCVLHLDYLDQQTIQNSFIEE